jgi:ribosome biogenesis protein Nip4
MIDFIKQFTDKEFKNIIKIRDSFYLVDDEILEIKNRISDEPQSIGIYLGQENKPSLALLELIAKHSDRKIFVDEKGEFLFLCGRNLMGRSIKKYNVDEGVVLIQNMNDENIGYGKVTGNLTRRDNEEKIVVKNILDRGNFLRREMH